jgi:glutamate-1-semialdehyde 2,1-aminomutase
MIKTQRTYKKSEKFLEDTLKYIPLGSQTFSKSKTQWPMGVSPYFMERAKGSKTYDIDGNEYIDLINGLCSITLGHCDEDVNVAVSAQLEKGVIFSMPHRLEKEVAQKIVEMVPSAEMVRFGKNGSDATSGAIRVARAYTKRDRVAVCGYHGWQDWYIGSTARWLGVPQRTRDITHTFAYNDIESLNEILNNYKDEFAAVIMEPMNVEFPKDNFLHKVKELAHQHGALFIFDETITGFRFSNGGAQELFGVTPDLSTFGKGLANGYAVSAVAGAEKYMRLMEEIFFSFTFGGECLSLAAALATMTKLQTQPVIKTITKTGEGLLSELEFIIQKYDLSNNFALKGHPAWSFFMIKESKDYTSWQLKSLFMQEMVARGILTFTTHNISYSHSKEDIQTILKAYNEVLAILKDTIENKALDKYLRCKPIEPLFKVR